MSNKKNIKTLIVLILSVSFLSAGAAPPPKPTPETSKTGVTQTLIDLLDKQDRTKIDPEDYDSTSLRQIITFGTPAGYRIKLRYLEFGISLVEALKVARDEELRDRLIEMVQWSRRPKVRAEAILTLASLYDPSHKKYFKEAVLDSKVGIRFAAVEALQIWNQKGTLPLLRLAMGRDWSPFMQIHAAQALLSLGEKDALRVLWKYIDHDSWVVRAMAARYLGDFGDPKDYDKLMIRFVKESKNDFVVAELAIAALKLISRKGDKVFYSPFQKGWADNEEVKFTIGKGGIVELEPLIIVPPRLRIPRSLRIASQINAELLNIIRERLTLPLDKVQAQDPVLQDLYGLVTPSGFGLQARYSQLSYLVIEGLAGARDLLIRSELENLARESSNPLVRASALIALAYNRDKRDLYLVQEGLRHKNAIVRMGAMEALEVGRFKEALPSVVGIAGNDPSPALQLYAIQLLSKFGDNSGRHLLITRLSEPDWPARAMAFWYLGRYGTTADYTLVVSRLSVEKNPFVQAEIALAALRLAPLED